MVAPGIFAQGGGCWRMAYESPVGQRWAPDGATSVAARPQPATNLTPPTQRGFLGC